MLITLVVFIVDDVDAILNVGASHSEGFAIINKGKSNQAWTVVRFSGLRHLVFRGQFSCRKRPFVEVDLSAHDDLACHFSICHEYPICVVWVLWWCSHIYALINFWLKFCALVFFFVGEDFTSKNPEVWYVGSLPKGMFTWCATSWEGSEVCECRRVF